MCETETIMNHVGATFVRIRCGKRTVVVTPAFVDEVKEALHGK